MVSRGNLNRLNNDIADMKNNNLCYSWSYEWDALCRNRVRTLSIASRSRDETMGDNLVARAWARAVLLLDEGFVDI